MTLTRLSLDSLRYYWRTHAAVALGVASAVAVIAGALLVGHSVRESLHALTIGRLGQTQVLVAADHPFTTALSDRLSAQLAKANAGTQPHVVPLFTLTGAARQESSGRRAHDVLVYGVDDRFFTFHGVTMKAPAESDALLSPDLGAELSVAVNDPI